MIFRPVQPRSLYRLLSLHDKSLSTALKVGQCISPILKSPVRKANPWQGAEVVLHTTDERVVIIGYRELKNNRLVFPRKLEAPISRDCLLTWEIVAELQPGYALGAVLRDRGCESIAEHWFPGRQVTA